MKIAKSHISESRNLRNDLKTGLIKAIDGLFYIIKLGGDQNTTGVTTIDTDDHEKLYTKQAESNIA